MVTLTEKEYFWQTFLRYREMFASSKQSTYNYVINTDTNLKNQITEFISCLLFLCYLMLLS